jgi:UDP-N-acetylmuramate dehydrogenase
MGITIGSGYILASGRESCLFHFTECFWCSLEAMLVEENKLLAPYTTFRIGGPARWFITAKCEAQVIEATDWAREKGVKLFVLGGGSNLLVSETGFEGLVLHIGLLGVQVESTPDESGGVSYQVAAGEDWDAFVERAVEDGCAGVECLAGIPGTVGGTPVQNVGAYGQEVAPVIQCVRAFDLERRLFVEFSAADCGFSYRRSRFNTTDRGRHVVTRVDYRLVRGGAPTLQYADLKRVLAGGAEPTLSDVAATVRQIRRSKGMLLEESQPDSRSAGSFFKNPIVSERQVEQIAATAGKQPPRFPAGAGSENAGRVKIPAAWLIEQAGFAKGYALGAAGISTLHTLALVNRGGAKARDILALAEQIGSQVAMRFGISLEMEPVLVGFERD